MDSAVSSMFLFEHFSLVVGNQTRVLAVSDMTSGDNITLVARLVHHCNGSGSVAKWKFVSDNVMNTVYILVESEDDVARMLGRCYRVGESTVIFRRVLLMEMRSSADDFYQDVQCHQVWPLTM